MSQRVYLESPYGGPDARAIQRNIRFARACLRDSLKRGEAPFASHLLYTQPGVLRDEDEGERQHGILSGFEFRDICERTVVYTNLGVSRGMVQGIEHARHSGQTIEYRELPNDWELTYDTLADAGAASSIWAGVDTV